MHRLLVTGGAGFIGANFVHYWLREHPGDAVVVLDALTYAGSLANLEPVLSNASLRFVEGDIRDGALVEQVLREKLIDTVVHFAAESHVDRSIHGPDVFLETNILGTHSLLKAARKVWLEERAQSTHRFHHVSTDEVYGSLSADEPAFHERSPYAPNSPYAASKAASDHLVRSYHKTYGLRTTISNCSNNYGAYQFPEKLIPSFVLKILHGRALPLYGDGRNVRDWIHVTDHCRAIDLILQNGLPGEVYNIGADQEWENLELVELLCGLVDEELRHRSDLKSKYPQCPSLHGRRASTLIRFVEDRPGHDRRYSIDCSWMRSSLGYSAYTTLEQGLRKTFLWYLSNEAWCRRRVDGQCQQGVDDHYSPRLEVHTTYGSQATE